MMHKSSQNLKALAPAKINLSLHVTGKTPQNYHLLDSLVVFADIGDMLYVSASSNAQSSYSVHMEHTKQQLMMDDDNLIVRAHKALEAFVGQKLICHIHLDKYLPMGAGIGGGSADAASILHLLNKYFTLHLSLQQLQEIGLPLGADVPVCLYAKSCYMHGIGEHITPIKSMPALHVGLVHPNKPASTKAVFERFSGEFSSSLNHVHNFSDFAYLYDWLWQHHNDLEDAASQIVPEIGHILTILREKLPENRAFCGMSGSGSTCFIVSPDASIIRESLALFADYPYQTYEGKLLKS